MSVVIRVPAGQFGWEKFVVFVVAGPVLAESANFAQSSVGGEGWKHA